VFDRKILLKVLNKERADPALIICLITAAYEGFQTPKQKQVLPYLTIFYQGVLANKKRARPWPSPLIMLLATKSFV
jgi:hypothetical protein